MSQKYSKKSNKTLSQIGQIALLQRGLFYEAVQTRKNRIEDMEKQK